MAITPRLAEDAAAATHWDATREAKSAEAPAVALSPWNAGKADEGLVDEFDWSDRVVKLAETAEMDATAAIGTSARDLETKF
jgi:hypothetical protein